MVFDRETQIATVVVDGYVTLQDKGRIISLTFGDIGSINPNDDGDSVTYTLKATRASVYKIFIKTVLGTPIEPDATATAYSERIALLIDA